MEPVTQRFWIATPTDAIYCDAGVQAALKQHLDRHMPGFEFHITYNEDPSPLLERWRLANDFMILPMIEVELPKGCSAADNPFYNAEAGTVHVDMPRAIMAEIAAALDQFKPGRPAPRLH